MQYKLCAFKTAFGDESGSIDCCSFFQSLGGLCQLSHHYRVYFTLSPAFHSCFDLFRQMPDHQIENGDACRGKAELFNLDQLALYDQ